MPQSGVQVRVVARRDRGVLGRVRGGVAAAGLLGMTLVLAGCGAGGDEQAARADSSGVSATQTAEAQSVGGGSEDGSSTPSSSETSSDDGGDYQPATKDGPAKNVPKPTMPDEMKKNTPEGAEAAVQYWWDTVYYLEQTGDSDPMMKASSKSCKYCREYADIIEDWYTIDKGWMEGSNTQVRNEIAIPVEGETQVMHLLDNESSTAWSGEGAEDSTRSQKSHRGETWRMDLVYDEDRSHWATVDVSFHAKGEK